MGGLEDVIGLALADDADDDGALALIPLGRGVGFLRTSAQGHKGRKKSGTKEVCGNFHRGGLGGELQ